MGNNFTSLDIVAIQKKQATQKESAQSFDINTIFLLLIVITLAILAGMLFLLIQKKMQELAIVGMFA